MQLHSHTEAALFAQHLLDSLTVPFVFRRLASVRLRGGVGAGASPTSLRGGVVVSPTSLLLLCGCIFLVSNVQATSPTDLFISEYIEGSSYNKAIEIYNGTGEAISLTGYSLELYPNGATTASQKLDLTGQVAAGDVYVVAHGSASATILALADLTNNSVINFNGDDAFVLKKNGTVLDVIGQVGVDPGTDWTSDGISTKDQTLTRKESICMGDANGTNAFDPAAEWNSAAIDTSSTLGSHSATCTITPPPPPTVSRIHTIQGSGQASPLVGDSVTISGVVVGDFQGSTELKSFMVQEEAADIDADPLTSEGIVVYCDTCATPVAIGDVVEVTGTVAEYYGLTQITAVTTTVLGTATIPAAVVLNLPFSDSDYLERCEGMLVTFPQTLYVTEHYTLARYGEVMLAVSARLDQPTNVVAPGAEANAKQAANNLQQILLDDGSNVQNPDPIKYSSTPSQPLSATDTLRGGDTAEGLTGVLSYGYSKYRLQPTIPVVFQKANLRPVASPAVAGNIKVAAFNVLNYFTTTQDQGNVCGPGRNMECRGANDGAELTRQQAKLVAALTALDADVVGLMELENTQQLALADLASRLPGYSYIANPAGLGIELGTDAITVGILYKTATLTPYGAAVTIADGFGSADLGTSCGEASDGVYPFDTFNRKPIAQTFSTGSGAKFTMVVNHFKSKGSATGYTKDIDAMDGQGASNCTRTQAATTLLQWLDTDPTGGGEGQFLIMGDLNAYAMEDPLKVFENAGFSNLVAGYSYVYSGQWGSLDHILASSGLMPQVAGGAKWHINADEPNGLDYNMEYKSPSQISSLYNADAYRTSDHDPVVVGLNLLPTARYNLSINKVGNGDGVVTSSPGEINCGAVCSDDYPQDSTVVLTAIPAADSDFAGWLGDCSEPVIQIHPVPCGVKMTAAKTITANFNRINTYTVTPSVGTGGTVSPNDAQTVNHGTAKAFTITPHKGYSLKTVVGGTCPQGTWNGNVWTTGPITANCTVAFSCLCQQCLPSMKGWRSAVALLRQIPSSRRTRTMAIHKITPSAGMGGTVIPNAMRLVLTGTRAKFTITPEAGNTATVTGTCGGIPTTGTVAFTYTTNPVSRDCTIEVSFATTALNKTALDTAVDTAATRITADPTLPAGQDDLLVANSQNGGTAIAFHPTELPILESSLFDFTKLDTNGQDLPADAEDYPCLRDNATGLIWEVKTQDGGLQDQNWSYTWYDANQPGGQVGTVSGGTCYTVGRCDSEKYTHDVNVRALCGGKNWRLPTIAELATIANSPLTQHQPPTWAAFDPSLVDGCNAMVVDFATGHIDPLPRSVGNAILLVRKP